MAQCTLIPPTHAPLRMRPITALLLLFVALVVVGGETPTLQERMSKEEFRAAELDKLSPAALKRLDDWLAAHPVTVTKMVSASNKPVFYTQDAARKRIDSRIAGLFTGWAGGTVFKLQNGQEWTQTQASRCAAGKLHDPKVRIEPALGSSWLLYVGGIDCDSVRVERIK